MGSDCAVAAMEGESAVVSGMVEGNICEGHSYPLGACRAEKASPVSLLRGGRRNAMHERPCPTLSWPCTRAETPSRCCCARRPGRAALLQACIDPLVAIGTLAAAVSFFGGRFDGACLILALLVFAMTFPGSLARDGGGSAGELALDVAAGWLAIVALLAVPGLGLAHARGLRPARHPRLVARHAGRAVRRAPAAAGAVAARARRRRHAEDRGHRRRQRPRPPARARSCAPTRCSACVSRATSTIAPPDGCRTSCRARTSARCPRSPTTRAQAIGGRHLHRAADGLAAADTQAAGGAARHHGFDLLRARHLRRRPHPGARRLHRRAAGGGGVRVAVLRLQRPGEARQRLRARGLRSCSSSRRSCWRSRSASSCPRRARCCSSSAATAWTASASWSTSSAP